MKRVPRSSAAEAVVAGAAAGIAVDAAAGTAAGAAADGIAIRSFAIRGK